MASRHDQARAMLSLDAQAGWDRFLVAARAAQGHGWGVADNCRIEAQFRHGSPDPYADFMSAVAGSSGLDAEGRFTEAAHDTRHQRQGRLATLPKRSSTILQHFANRDSLREQFAEPASSPHGTSAHREMWRALCDLLEASGPASDSVRTPTALDELVPSPHQVFATFDESRTHVFDAHVGPGLGGGSLRERLDRCGLPPTCDKYAPGEHIWRLCFRFDGPTFLPTVADAGWTPEFRPETNPSAEYGRAWDISGWDPTTDPLPHGHRRAGHPEVVVAPLSAPVDWACIPVDEGMVPP